MAEVWDIVGGIVVMAFLAVCLFAVGARVSRSCPRWVSGAVALCAVASLVLFEQFVHGELFLTRILPFSNVIVLSNWLPLGGALLAGLIWGRANLPMWRRAIGALALALVSAYCLVEVVLGEPPLTRELWSADGVCLQSDESTCSAASAATLLRHAGIPSTEREMARLCLTRDNGTSVLGLYRGLKIKTRGTPWKVEAFKADIAGLRGILSPPVVVSVGVKPGSNTDPMYAQDWGWTPGVAHSVVVYGFAGNKRIDVADPSVGREQWYIRDLRVLWRGEGLQLLAEPRDRAGSQ
ncbi:MAG: cysteine peptidase family C39 domain-containing protein [Candidatus Brocadiia bacterium]|nr:cysteine peptidase family C39 domain-containing protein [Candidatus Brocadiia bacterium]